MKISKLFLLSLLAVLSLKPCTPEEFLYYARNGSLIKVKKCLAAKINVNFKNSFGNTALILAARNGYKEIVKELIKVGANPNIQNKEGDTALIAAAIMGNEEIVKKLIKAKADLNIQNRDGDSALICAVEKGHLGIVRELIKAEANPNIQNEYGNTALMWAVVGGNEEVVKELIKAGADPNIGGNTPLIWAASHDDRILEKLFLNAMSERLKQPHTPELNEFMDADLRKALSRIDLHNRYSFPMLKEFDRFARKHPEDFPGLEKEITRRMRLAMKYQIARRGTRPFKEMKEYIRTSR